MKTKGKDLLTRITVDPKVLAGKPAIRGLRISVEQVLAALAGGLSHQEILEDLPELEPQDILAALQYAANQISDEEIYPVEAR